VQKKRTTAYNNYSEGELNVMKVYDEAHKERLETDAIYRLEHEHKEKEKLRVENSRLQRLQEIQERDKHDYDNNQILRKMLRDKKRRQEALNITADRKGLGLKLLEITEEDKEMASKISFKRKYKPKSNHMSTSENVDNNNSNKTAQIDDYIAANAATIGNTNVSMSSKEEILSAKQKLKMQRLKVKNESIFKRKRKQTHEKTLRRANSNFTKVSRHIRSSLFKKQLDKKNTLSNLSAQYKSIYQNHNQNHNRSSMSSGIFGLNRRNGFGLCVLIIL